MAKHEFGIMNAAPAAGKRYDEYEPRKYHCIRVEDDYLENNLGLFLDIDTFSHSIDTPAKGLVYWGITLIPPTSHKAVISRIAGLEGLQELRDLLEKARLENKFVIHFGI